MEGFAHGTSTSIGLWRSGARVLVGLSRRDGYGEAGGDGLRQACGDVVALLAELGESLHDLALARDAQRLPANGAVAVELTPEPTRHPGWKVLFTGHHAPIVVAFLSP